jgi:hypothetical protein
VTNRFIHFSKNTAQTGEKKRMNNIHKIALFSLSVLLLAGCMSFQEAGIERGQTVFNRVSFRSVKGNTIYYANRIYGGILISAGTECTINDFTSGAIKFTANGDKYVLRQWLIGQGTEDARVSFEKFFLEDKEAIGLDKINPKFQKNISSGIVEVGMTKQEVLLSTGYPSYLGRRHRTRNETRERILAHSDWYYLKTGRRKILLRFKGEELAEVIGK